jgi:prevent-host-death family protein
MRRAVSAADANRDFSKLLRQVRDGRSYVITNHGKPVAKIVPVNAHDRIRAAARGTLFTRLEAQSATFAIGPWTRDELYQD